MTLTRLAAFIFAAALNTLVGNAAATFVGFTPNIDGASNVRIDWSSDFGIDYVMHSNNPLESIPVAPGPVWGFNSFEANRSLEMEVNREVIPDTSTLSAAGRIDIGSAGAVGLHNVHTMYHRQTLNSSAAQYGFSAATALQGQFLFSDVSAENPLYWGIEWTIKAATYVAPANASRLTGYALLNVDGATISPDPMPFSILGDRTLTGGLFGATTDGNFTLWTQSSLMFSGDAELEWDIRVAFSNDAFNDIPDRGTSVPDTGSSAAMAALAAAALGLMKRWLRKTV
jgi:hypothetical protein